SDLCSIKSCVFFRHFVKIHSQTICQLSNRNGNSACAKVITLLDETADFFSAEHSLNLTLCRRISFLNFRTTGLDGCLCMYFGRTGRTAASVSSCPSAEQNDDIARIGCLTDD